MKRLLGLAALLFLVCPAEARSKIQGWCQDGNTAVTIPGTQGSGSQRFQRSYPSCTVTVYSPAASLTLATIYADSAGTAKANPFTAASNGQWFFYIDESSCDTKFSGGGISSPFTLGDACAAVSTWRTEVFSGATIGARINACLTALPSTGGTCDARFDTNTMTIAADPFSGITKPFNLLIDGTITTSVGMRIGNGNNQRIIGTGPRQSLLVASASFPTSTAVLSIGKTNGAFSSFVRGVTIDCTDISGSIGLDLDGVQEGSVSGDIAVGQCSTYAIRFSSNSGFAAGSTQNAGIEDFEANVGNSTGSGVFVAASSAGRIYISNGTINNDGGFTSTGDGLYHGAGVLYAYNLHFERYANGIRKVTNSFMHAIGIIGHSTVTDLIHIDNTYSYYNLMNIEVNGGTRAVNDVNRSRQIAGSVDYMLNEGGASSETNWAGGNTDFQFAPPATANPGMRIRIDGAATSTNSALRVHFNGGGGPNDKTFDVRNDGATLIGNGSSYVTGWTTGVTTALTFTTVNANTCTAITTGLTGAVVATDGVFVSPVNVNPGAGLVWKGRISANNIVEITLCNPTAGNIVSVDATWKCVIIR